MAEEEHYSNRQIERMLDLQTAEFKDIVKAATDPILEQTKKTNGRVTKSEVDIVNQKVWSGRIMGGLAIVSLFITSLIGLQVWMVVKILDIPNQIHTALDEGFNVRNLTR